MQARSEEIGPHQLLTSIAAAVIPDDHAIYFLPVSAEDPVLAAKRISGDVRL